LALKRTVHHGSRRPTSRGTRTGPHTAFRGIACTDDQGRGHSSYHFLDSCVGRVVTRALTISHLRSH
jgi:hypothetical protein